MQLIPPSMLVGTGNAAASLYYRKLKSPLSHPCWEDKHYSGPKHLGSIRYSNLIYIFRRLWQPAGDSSIGEQLYNLCQGSMPINYYALKFRTLTAASGWNERSLLTTYRQGLEPRVWLQLSAYDDSYGFERFISTIHKMCESYAVLF